MKVEKVNKMNKPRGGGDSRVGNGFREKHDRPKKVNWKAKKKLVQKKKEGMVISKINSSQNWKQVAEQIKDVQTRYRKDPKKMEKLAKKVEEKKTQIANQKEEIENEKQENEPVTKIEEEAAVTPKITKAVAMDCEMVGVGANGVDSIVARVSLVNEHCECIYDVYVLPTEEVTDYRTRVSGIRPGDLTRESGAKSFKLVQKEVADLIEGHVLVGHALNNDLDVLFLSHPRKKTRDTQKVSKLFRQVCPTFKGGLTSLKSLAKQLLGIDIQEGEHSSVQDAQAAMRIYKTYKKDWEAYLRTRKMGGVDGKKKGAAENAKIAIVMNNDNEPGRGKGNENHKRFVRNKLNKRQNFLKVFKK